MCARVHLVRIVLVSNWVWIWIEWILIKENWILAHNSLDLRTKQNKNKFRRRKTNDRNFSIHWNCVDEVIWKEKKNEKKSKGKKKNGVNDDSEIEFTLVVNFLVICFILLAQMEKLNVLRACVNFLFGEHFICKWM